MYSPVAKLQIYAVGKTDVQLVLLGCVVRADISSGWYDFSLLLSPLP